MPGGSTSGDCRSSRRPRPRSTSGSPPGQDRRKEADWPTPAADPLPGLAVVRFQRMRHVPELSGLPSVRRGLLERFIRRRRENSLRIHHPGARQPPGNVRTDILRSSIAAPEYSFITFVPAPITTHSSAGITKCTGEILHGIKKLANMSIVLAGEFCPENAGIMSRSRPRRAIRGLARRGQITANHSWDDVLLLRKSEI
jgi:hypothetical protein